MKLPGYGSSEVVEDHLRRARAFVFAAEEDFGIAPVEAQAAGCPVIAFGKGGALETVVGHPAPGATGVFFDEQMQASLSKAVARFEADFDPETCRKNAERFGPERFRKVLLAAVEEAWEAFHGAEARG